MKNILITGGSGLLGTQISKALIKKGYKVSWLSRSAGSKDNITIFQWNPKKGEVDKNALKGVDIILHLAGASVGGQKWTEEYKMEMRNSRIQAADVLFKACQSLGETPSQFISASGIGYYGYDAGSIWKNEESRFGDDFLATLSKDWEEAAKQFKSLSTAVTIMRTGIVFGKTDSALQKLVTPIKWGVGAPLGSGNQYMSWIHIDDLVNSYLHVIENSIEGIFNQCAPEPETNRLITKAIAKTLKRPLILPSVPKLILQLMLGEFSASITGSMRVSPQKLIDSGYVFKHPELEKALADLLGNNP